MLNRIGTELDCRWGICHLVYLHIYITPVKVLPSILITYFLLQVGVTISGVTYGAMLGLFSLGMFFPWANTKVKCHIQGTKNGNV
jgi:hypothetical protein